MKSNELSDYEASNSYVNESSFENSECIKKEKRIKLKMKKERIYKKKCHGSWGDLEELKFSSFMQAHRKIFEDKSSRRTNKIFRQMAKYVCTRSSEQCRSHHQKYEMRFGSFDKTIAFIENKLRSNSKSCSPVIAKSHIKQEVLENYFQFHTNNTSTNFPVTQSHSFDSSPKSTGSKLQEILPTMVQFREHTLEEDENYLIERKESKNLWLNIMINLDTFF